MNSITLNKKILITLFLLLWGSIGWTQEPWCMVYDDLTLSERTALGISEQEWMANKSPNTNSSPVIVPNDYPIVPKKFRIKFWTIQTESDSLMVKRRDNTDTLIYGNDVSAYWLNSYLARRHTKLLNNYYKDQQICFELKGIGVFKTDSIYYGTQDPEIIKPSTTMVSYIAFREHAIEKNAYDENAINIYIRKDTYGGSAAAGMNVIMLGQSYLYNTVYNVLAHEMGHTFGLIHTHGRGNRPLDGTCYIPSYHSGNCEHVTRDPNDPNYNALTHGDEVHDTAADPGLFSLTTGGHANCYNQDANCDYVGDQVDCQGTPYALDDSVLRNIMSYGNVICATDFTPGQRTRMHYLIENGDVQGRDYSMIRAALIQPNDLSGFDLMLRNSDLDFGYEPDTVSTIFWNSPDIWVRNQNDSNDSIYHQNPVYGIGNNYVKVRVVNRGCAPSDGTGKLKLYWTKAGTNLPMQVWNGGFNFPWFPPLGGMIGEVNLPVLESYEEHIFTFPWAIPNPANYGSIFEPWHFCLMAKIETSNDVSALPEDDGMYYQFLNSNNIALHNVNVMPIEEATSGKIYIGNFEPAGSNFKLKLSRDLYNFPHTNIFEEAEVKIEFDTKLWNIWQESGFEGSGYTVYGDKTVIVNEHTEIILNNFPPDDFGIANVHVNFLIPDYTPNTDFGFNVEHWNNDTNQLMGGELYLVHKNERELFDADGYLSGASLNAIPVNEPAAYNWYDSNGNLVHTGQTYNLTNSNGTYLLEVISDYDGFKDYKEINVTAVSFMKNMYPNPAGSSVTIEYEPLSCNTAYIMLVNINNNSTTNHILDLNEDHITIDVSQLPAGLYRVVLVCDNNVMESDNLIIQ